DEEGNCAGLLGRSNLFLDTTDGFDVSIGCDLSSPGQVTPSQQRSVGDLVIDRQSENQAGAGTADLLSEVEGDVRVVAISGSQGDADNGNVGLDVGFHCGYGDIGLNLVADDDKPHLFTNTLGTYLLGHRLGIRRWNAVDRYNQVAWNQQLVGGATHRHRVDGRHFRDRPTVRA